MKCRPHPFIAAAVVGVLATTPAVLFGQQPATPPAHAEHSPAPPSKIDELLKRVQSASSDARMAAMTELLEALVAERHSCADMMVKKHEPAPK